MKRGRGARRRVGEGLKKEIIRCFGSFVIVEKVQGRSGKGKIQLDGSSEKQLENKNKGHKVISGVGRGSKSKEILKGFGAFVDGNGRVRVGGG